MRYEKKGAEDTHERSRSAGTYASRDIALNYVTNFLSQPRIGARRLSQAELAQYSKRSFQQGWRMLVPFSDKERRIDVLADRNFPRDPVRVALVDRPEFLTWPHIEKDGLICLVPSSTTVDFSQPVEVCAQMIEEACTLVQELLQGEHIEDFRDEFESYWGWSTNNPESRVISLIRTRQESRVVKYYGHGHVFVIADNEQELRTWLNNYIEGGDSSERRVNDAALLWLNQVLIPSEFPGSGSEIMKIAKAHGEEEILDSICREQTKNALVVLGAMSSNGPCYGATVVSCKEIGKGFRPGHVPAKIVRARMFGNGRVKRVKVRRADAAWAHGRESDTRFDRLRSAKVVIFGCGSVGGNMAVKLAESGVGVLYMFDPENLDWPNLGRHPLGARNINANKAEALSEKISADYPHIIEACGSSMTCEEALVKQSDKITGCDLIISATGSWVAEGSLNAWHCTMGRGMPILYTWTEPHGCAGHAVAISNSGGCFQCGVSSCGQVKLAVGEWPNDTMRQQPECGAVFQPYGPIELSHTTALAADLAIDCLLNEINCSCHRIWCGRKSRLVESGGQWTGEWAEIAGDRKDGGFSEHLMWKSDSECLECGTTNSD